MHQSRTFSSRQTPYYCFGCKANGKVGSEWHRPGCRAPKWEPVVVLPTERAAALLRLEAMLMDEENNQLFVWSGDHWQPLTLDRGDAYRAALKARMEGGT